MLQEARSCVSKSTGNPRSEQGMLLCSPQKLNYQWRVQSVAVLCLVGVLLFQYGFLFVHVIMAVIKMASLRAPWFTKLTFTFSSLVKPVEQMKSI